MRRSALVSVDTLPVTAKAPIRTDPAARAGLAFVVAGYIIAFSLWTVRNHYGFGTFGFDLGIFDQGVWLLSQFDRPFVTILGLHLFGDHTSFILLPLVPFYWVFPTPVTLLMAQSVALGSAAIPAFLIAREKLRSELLALGAAIAYLAHPAVGWANVEQFHPDVFEVPLLFFALYCIMRERWAWFLICVVALLSVKEDVPLLTVTLGAYVAIWHNRRVGLATVGMSVAWFVAAVWVVLPFFNDVGSLDQFRIPFGGTGGALRTLVTAPWRYVQLALEDDRPFYLWQLLIPAGLLSLLAPRVALIAALPLASNLFSTFWYQYHIQYHYTTLLVPVIVVAAIFGAARFRSPQVRNGLVAGMVACALFTGWYWGPATFARKPNPFANPNAVSASLMRRAIAVIPPDAAVSVHYAAVTHLGHRRHVYQWPTPFRAEYWGDWRQEGKRLEVESKLVDYVLVTNVTDPRDRAIVEELRDTDFEPIFENLGVLVLRRRAR